MEYKSDQINELAAALAKAQAEMPIAEMNSSNPYFKTKYTDLASYIKTSRPYLTRNGLSVVQLIMFDDKGDQFLQTMLLHSSGQFLSSYAKITPAKSDVQSFGSYLTYLRRYSYSAIIGCASGNEDDDGESSVRKQEMYIHHNQVMILENMLLSAPELKEALLNALRLNSFSQLPADKFDRTIQWIESQLSK